MESIFEKGVRRVVRRLFGPDVAAFVLDDDWQGLLFVPENGADRRAPAAAGPVHCVAPPWPCACDACPAVSA